MVKKGFVLIVGTALAMSSCGTYAGQGGNAGAMFGSVIGSAIGGISGGPRGSDIGTLVGMAGGAAVGAVIGAAADKNERVRYEQSRSEHDAHSAHRHEVANQDSYNMSAAGSIRYDAVDSGFDPTNSGDDRITFETSQDGYDIYGDSNVDTGVEASREDIGQSPVMTMEQLSSLSHRHHHGEIGHKPLLEIRNVVFADADGDGMICRGEECKVSFDIMNNSPEPLYGINPAVIETTGNKHIFISPSISVDCINPKRGIRYTATIIADKRLKDGEAVVNLSASIGDDRVGLQERELRIVTKKK